LIEIIIFDKKKISVVEVEKENFEEKKTIYLKRKRNISPPLPLHLSHLAADTTLYGSLLNKSLIHDCWRKQSFSLFDFVHCLLQ
jgi:hypothetical protein